MVDFSCALKLSMPLAVLSAMRECGDYHITVKGGKYLEAVAKADTIVFDKTGTLTHASPAGGAGGSVRRLRRSRDAPAGRLPGGALPPLHGQRRGAVPPGTRGICATRRCHSEVEYIVAHGIASTRRAVSGWSSAATTSSLRMSIAPFPQGEHGKFDDLAAGVFPPVSWLLPASWWRVICIADPLRAEAARCAVRQLRALGISNTVMMTGDSDRTAAAIAAQVGVDQYFARRSCRRIRRPMCPATPRLRATPSS